MAKNIADVIQNIKTIYMTDSSLNSLLDFERVIDELDVYAFENWKNGELVAGPKYEKYFVSCVFMWPYKKMPDPRGAERLLDYDCEIKYKKDVLKVPKRIKSPNDLEPGTKMPQMKQVPIWLVEIVMPKRLMQEIHRGSLELENDSIDAEDIEQAYETGADEKVYQADQPANTAAQEQPQPQ